MSQKKDAAVARRKFTSQNVEIMKGVRATLGNYGQKIVCGCGATQVYKSKC